MNITHVPITFVDDVNRKIDSMALVLARTCTSSTPRHTRRLELACQGFRPEDISQYIAEAEAMVGLSHIPRPKLKLILGGIQ